MTIINDFNSIARIYDVLAKIVFGKSIKQAQTVFLQNIPTRGKVLILGGGTGWILEALDKLEKSCEVTYIDASSAMIAKAKEYNHELSNIDVTYIMGTENAIPEGSNYDVIITNFFLDLFSKANLSIVMKKIVKVLKPEGCWIFTDFQQTNIYWQKALVKFMYMFFRLVCNIEGTSLHDWHEAFKEKGFKPSAVKTYFYGMIMSVRYTLM